MKRVAMIVILATAILLVGSCTWFLGLFESVEVNGEEVELTNLLVFQVTTQDGDYANLVVLLSDGITYSESDSFNGEGVFVSMLILSETPTIGEGTYEVGPVEWAAPAVDSSEALLNATFENGIPTEIGTAYEFDDGQMVVTSDSGENLVIEFDFSGQDSDTGSDATMVGTYRGPIDAVHEGQPST